MCLADFLHLQAIHLVERKACQKSYLTNRRQNIKDSTNLHLYRYFTRLTFNLRW